MKIDTNLKKSGFTLLETVIAIGVLAVLLTGFLGVFGPAAVNIRRSLNAQEADRLATSLERELVTVHQNETTTTIKTGFDKAFIWIEESADPKDAIFAYQYRANPGKRRQDDTLEPVVSAKGQPGKDYVVLPIVRRLSDPLFLKDLPAIEGGLFLVKCTQLIFDEKDELVTDPKQYAGKISDPVTRTTVSTPSRYPAAVIAFSAEFHAMPTKAPNYFRGPAFKKRFESANSPVFVRNLAVRR